MIFVVLTFSLFHWYFLPRWTNRAVMELATTTQIQSPFNFEVEGCGTPSELAQIWEMAVARYNETSGFQLEEPATRNVDGILAMLHEKDELFKSYRHDGSKVDKFRSLLSSILTPVQMLSDVASKAVTAVSSMRL